MRHCTFLENTTTLFSINEIVGTQHLQTLVYFYIFKPFTTDKCPLAYLPERGREDDLDESAFTKRV